MAGGANRQVLKGINSSGRVFFAESDRPWVLNGANVHISLALSLLSAPTPSGKPVVGLVRYPRLVPKDSACAKLLKARTLTNLYNERPTWLDLAHQKLDAAVFAAYAWDPAMGDEEILEKLLALNLERAADPDKTA